MRIGSGFGLSLLLASGLCAQVAHVGGSVVNPGGASGIPGVTRTLGSVVNPANGGLRVPGSRPAPNSGRAVYAYPVYIGGYYSTPFISTPDDSSYAAPAQAPANVTVVMPPQQPVTPVVINYNYGGAVPVPVPGEPDRAPANAQQDDTASGSTHYLIAMKDHMIYAATAYWVDGDTLHYFTEGNVHNQTSLSLVDRDFTSRLNKEAGVEVVLPTPAK